MSDKILQTPKYAKQISKTLPANGSLTFSGDELSRHYIIVAQGTMGNSTFAAIGGGYGKEAVRHNVVTLISSSYFSVSQGTDSYSLTITSTLSESVNVSVTQLQ